MKSGWQKYLLYASIVIVGGGLLFILVKTVQAKNTGFETKTLWEWMELLIIPAVLAGGAILINRSERALERKIADERTKEDRKIAEDRARLERELATDRQQEAALQAYFDRMSELLLKEKLRTTNKAEVRDVARTRTISIMRVLDTKRNNLIIQFLREAKLINDKKSILNGANMEGIDLQNMSLYIVHLQDAGLINANLSGADLSSADLSGADLSGARLGGADLSSANLPGAILSRANLSGADLWEANLTSADLSIANLSSANLSRADLQVADLRGADLSSARLNGANLLGANFLGANLSRADLQVADLRGADLSSARLDDANLLGARNLTEEQLIKLISLKGATMPNGTKHE